MGLFSAAKPKEPEKEFPPEPPLPTPLGDALCKKIDQIRSEREVCAISLCVLSSKDYKKLVAEIAPLIKREKQRNEYYGQWTEWRWEGKGIGSPTFVHIRCGCGACKDSITLPEGHPARVDLSLDDLGI